LLEVIPKPSVTVITKLNVPEFVGVPLRTPVAGSIVIPFGKVPLLMEYVSGDFPPPAGTSSENLVPVVALVLPVGFGKEIAGLIATDAGERSTASGRNPLFAVVSTRMNLPTSEFVGE
jgi:hypothetical protein